MLKSCVLRLRLKLGRVSVDLTDSARLFQTVGPATGKARSVNLVCGQFAHSSYTVVSVAGNHIVILLSDMLCLEMCLADISGIHFTATAQHRSCGHTGLSIVLLKVS